MRERNKKEEKKKKTNIPTVEQHTRNDWIVCRAEKQSRVSDSGDIALVRQRIQHPADADSAVAGDAALCTANVYTL